MDIFFELIKSPLSVAAHLAECDLPRDWGEALRTLTKAFPLGPDEQSARPGG